jgi:hypothetical protein
MKRKNKKSRLTDARMGSCVHPFSGFAAKFEGQPRLRPWSLLSDWARLVARPSNYLAIREMLQGTILLGHDGVLTTRDQRFTSKLAT